MAKKKYISLTGIQYTFPVTVKDKTVWVSFKGSDNSYVTAKADVQRAIESTDKFKNKVIGLSGEFIEDEDLTGKAGQGEPKFEIAEFLDVADINSAVAILSGEPYKVAKSKLKTPDRIKTAMAECSVSFPNLQL